MKFFFISLLVLGYVSVSGIAAAAEPGATKVSVSLPKQNPGIMIRFEETPARVLLETVCTNYPKDSLDYRHCRQEAKYLFGARCFSATQALNGSRQPEPVLKTSQKKWCDAGKDFKP